MANEEHLKIFMQGAEVWNRWRAQTNVEPDLSDVNLPEINFAWGKLNLSRMNLRGMDFSYTTFNRADFSESDLSAGSFDFGHFMWANFTNANLDSAFLIGSDLRFANFNGANLSNTNLDATNLSDANLESTNFSGAKFGKTILGNNDLSRVIGLNSVWHAAPSIIGIDTLYLSGGNIPEDFLRGCGVPDELIAYLPSLIGARQAIQFYSCFISYSSRDEEFCRRLHSRMRAEHLRVWFAPEDVKGGEKLYEQIDRAIQMHDRLLIVLSEESLKSKWVMTEIRRARRTELREGRRKLFPIRLCSYEQLRDWECLDADSGEDLAVEVRGYFIPDFSNWKDHDAFESAFDKLLKDLRAAEGNGAAVS
ncbi:MAG TPA: toll/interleukin-1 receptor domain-containing protein [Pyrinomonadaceae bacterium]|jgi:hypothetical protein